MKTALTELLGIDAPIVLAPMGGAVTSEFAAAVSNAGGIGMLPLSWNSPEEVANTVTEMKALTNAPFGINLIRPRSACSTCFRQGWCRFRHPPKPSTVTGQKTKSAGSILMQETSSVAAVRHDKVASQRIAMTRRTLGEDSSSLPRSCCWR